jgi:hypothetical protein
MTMRHRSSHFNSLKGSTSGTNAKSIAVLQAMFSPEGNQGAEHKLPIQVYMVWMGSCSWKRPAYGVRHCWSPTVAKSWYLNDVTEFVVFQTFRQKLLLAGVS